VFFWVVFIFPGGRGTNDGLNPYLSRSIVCLNRDLKIWRLLLKRQHTLSLLTQFDMRSTDVLIYISACMCLKLRSAQYNMLDWTKTDSTWYLTARLKQSSSGLQNIWGFLKYFTLHNCVMYSFVNRSNSDYKLSHTQQKNCVFRYNFNYQCTVINEFFKLHENLHSFELRSPIFVNKWACMAAFREGWSLNRLYGTKKKSLCITSLPHVVCDLRMLPVSIGAS
jgi:hypothetical protein